MKKPYNLKPLFKAHQTLVECNRAYEDAKKSPRTKNDAEYMAHRETDCNEAHDALAAEKAKLDVLIAEAQGRARTRTIDADTVYTTLKAIEEKLDLPKKALEGTTAIIDPNADDFPSAYKWIPESTIFRAEFKGGSWRITGIERDRTRRYNMQTVLHLPDAAKQALIDRYTVFRV